MLIDELHLRADNDEVQDARQVVGGVADTLKMLRGPGGDALHRFRCLLYFLCSIAHCPANAYDLTLLCVVGIVVVGL